MPVSPRPARTACPAGLHWRGAAKHTPGHGRRGMTSMSYLQPYTLIQSHYEANCWAQRAMPPKVGRNEPCPCGSGLKYKRCCLNQERRMSKWDYARRYNKAFSQNECLVPEPLKHECDNGIAKAHTVPRNCLKRIARNGHVSSFLTTPHLHPGQAPATGLLHARRAGVNKASTFSGFCPKHDNDLFAPLEKTPFCATPEQCFLLAYRAFAREYYVKRVAAANIGLLREAAMGQPLPQQILAHGLSTAFNAGAHDNVIQKATYDKILEARQFHDVRAYVVEFRRPPSVMCAAAVNPTHDFEGRVLQDLSDLDRVPDLLSFTSFSEGTTGMVVLTWLKDSDKTCLPMVETLVSFSDDDITSALLRLFFSMSENIHMDPDWWNNLPAATQRALVHRLSIGADLEQRPNERALVDDGMVLDRWPVHRRYPIQLPD